MKRTHPTAISAVLIGLSLVLLTSCKAPPPAISNPITIPLDECPYPLEMAEPPLVNAMECGELVCLPKPDIEGLVAYNYEAKRYIDDAIASLDFCNRQVRDNNEFDGE